MWVDNQVSICEVVGNYFRNIFDGGNIDRGYSDFLDAVNCVITPPQNQELIQDFWFEEFTAAVKQMHGDKAPGPDGFNPSFFHKCWSLVGRDIFLASVQWLQQRVFPQGSTILTLCWSLSVMPPRL